MDISYLNTEHLLSCTDLNFCGRVDLDTNELLHPFRAEEYDYQFKLNPIVKEMTGSIHKTINVIDQLGNHNHNDLSIDRIKTELERLQLDYGIDPSKTKLRGIEFGFNIEVDNTPSSIITNHIIAWNRYPVARNMIYNGLGRFYEWRQSQYLIKIYDKSDQYKLNTHKMRFEKKVIRSEYLNKMGIYYLSDLVDPKLLRVLADDLLFAYDKLLFIDEFDSTVLSHKDQIVWSKMINPKYWENYSKSTQPQLIRKRHQRDREAFNRIVEKYQLDSTKKLYKERIRNKMDVFINVTK